MNMMNNNQLFKTRYRYLVKCDQPLVFISQIGRSGGTLLSRLFDMHPECHVHPHELKIGESKNYPDLKLNDMIMNLRGIGKYYKKWFNSLYEQDSQNFFLNGYKKERKDESFPFMFLSDLQRKIFLKQVKSFPLAMVTQRDILNAYMTSYFNAWLDNSNLYNGVKKYVVGFCPSTADKKENVDRFFRDYPDGFLVQIVRNPLTWWVSYEEHLLRNGSGVKPDLKTDIVSWKKSVESMLDNKKKYGDRVFIIRFESLLNDTERVMKGLSGFLDISFDGVLLRPSFNGMDVRANSSFYDDGFGVLSSPVKRDELLSDEVREYIDSVTLDLYSKLKLK